MNRTVHNPMCLGRGQCIIHIRCLGSSFGLCHAPQNKAVPSQVGFHHMVLFQHPACTRHPVELFVPNPCAKAKVPDALREPGNMFAAQCGALQCIRRDVRKTEIMYPFNNRCYIVSGKQGTR